MFQKERDWLQGLDAMVSEKYPLSVARSIRLACASGAGNLLIGIGKLLIGVFSLSLFTCMSAFYTLCMALAKACAIAGIPQTTMQAEPYKWLRRSAYVLLFASLMYAGYSLRLFFAPSLPSFHPYVALGIATVTFCELGMNLRGLLMARKYHSLPIQALKTISMSASLICLVLTQASLLALSSKASMETHASATGLLGLILSLVTALLGILLMIRINRVKQRTEGNVHDTNSCG
ncbi:MAG: hypothetical protein Q4D04_05115 [Clostridia bacterium]|nr:hypothetical protein [Clostridia bacterium]